MDKASNHTLNSTAIYLTKAESQTEINYVPFGEIPLKSSDISLMDFCALACYI